MQSYIDSVRGTLGGRLTCQMDNERLRNRWHGRFCKAGRIMGRAVFATIMLVSVLGTQNLWAATAAYWRHEEGPSGSIVPDGAGTVLDSSASGNPMQTFSSANAPFTAATYSPLVSPLALRSGSANNLALDFGPNPTIGAEDGADPFDDNGKNDDNYTDNTTAPITTQLFTAMTVELAFNMNTVDSSYQNLFGKDGKPLGDDELASPTRPLRRCRLKSEATTFPTPWPTNSSSNGSTVTATFIFSRVARPLSQGNGITWPLR